MNPPSTTLPVLPASPALDFAALCEEGLVELRRLAGGAWTDHNLHDPGITLLELLCYGLTDVAYRTTAADADLFAVEPAKPAAPGDPELEVLLPAVPDRGPFLTARDALTCEPVTANDYRRLILDAFPTSIRNVWVEPGTRNLFADPEKKELRFKATAKTIAFQQRGFHRIRLQLHQSFAGAGKKKQRDELLAAVARVYHAHRNLGEDLLSVAVTDSLPIRVCVDIQLAAAADIEKTHAAIVHALQSFLNPSVPRHPLADLIASHRTEEIFNGPTMVNGFILEEDLDRTTSVNVVRSSDLIAEILRIPGVVAIPNILLNFAASSAESEHWELAIPANVEPSLDFADARLRFFKDLIPFDPDTAESLAELEKLRAAELARNDFPDAEDFPIPAGTWADPGEFTTLQESLPATYGCGSRGLNRDRSPGGLARARQLQAFLLVFDQILANDLGQLSNLAKLLSADPNLTRSLFGRAVSDLPALRELLRDTAADAAATEAGARELYPDIVRDTLADAPAEELHRSAILDHLLARAGERLADEVLMHHGTFGNRSVAAMIHAKGTFLGELPEIAARRGRGHDLMDPQVIWDTTNVSGFKHRLERLLGFPTYTRRSLSDITYDFYEEKDTDSKSEIRFRIVDRKSKKKKPLLSGTTKYKTKAAAVTALRRAIQLGMQPSNYDVKQSSDGRWFVTIVDRQSSPPDIVAMRKHLFATEAEAIAVRDQLAAIVSDRFSEEGCFVVEHLPMWPRNASWPLLAVPLEARPDSPQSWDPYSFHVHIILPGWGARLADTGFRAFVEQAIHRELPAHLVARVCFIGREQMREFELTYRAWLTALATATDDSATVLADFIACLESLYTIYPTGTLHDRKEDGDEVNPVVLGRTHLGSNAPPET